jgi:hypothetical protein
MQLLRAFAPAIPIIRYYCKYQILLPACQLDKLSLAIDSGSACTLSKLLSAGLSVVLTQQRSLYLRPQAAGGDTSAVELGHECMYDEASELLGVSAGKKGQALLHASYRLSCNVAQCDLLYAQIEAERLISDS